MITQTMTFLSIAWDGITDNILPMSGGATMAFILSMDYKIIFVQIAMIIIGATIGWCVNRGLNYLRKQYLNRKKK